MVADAQGRTGHGKVYVGGDCANGGKEVVNAAAEGKKAARAIHKAEKTKVEKEYLLAKIEFPTPIRSTPVIANGVLYVMTEHSLFALKTK